MEVNEHRFRLHKRRNSFYDPVNKLHLHWPACPEGKLPLEADLTFIKPAVLSGDLIDVNKTVLKSEDAQMQEVLIVGTCKLDSNPIDTVSTKNTINIPETKILKESEENEVSEEVVFTEDSSIELIPEDEEADKELTEESTANKKSRTAKGRK